MALAWMNAHQVRTFAMAEMLAGGGKGDEDGEVSMALGIGCGQTGIWIQMIPRLRRFPQVFGEGASPEGICPSALICGQQLNVMMAQEPELGDDFGNQSPVIEDADHRTL